VAREQMKVLVLVKAAPVLTRELEETMCVAGVRVDADDPSWIRLHPVPFRDLEEDRKFAKYQVVDVEVERPKSDRRPESWSPLRASISPGQTLTPTRAWAERRQVIEQLGESFMCELVEMNRSGSAPGTPSLAVVRPQQPPRLIITERDESQLRQWTARAQGAANRLSLFDDPGTRKPEFEVVPWRFQYDYQCAASGCRGHRQTIVDWEVLALWRKVRRQPDWREQMRAKFEDTLWTDRDSVLFVGNQEQHPASFLVLGVFWPPSRPYQPSLL